MKISAKNIVYFIMVLILSLMLNCGGDSDNDSNTFTDKRDGKTYKTVQIGSQIWMAENLNYDAPGSKFYYDNPANGKKYGRLYDQDTALTVAPAGWHLPSEDEWTTLIEYVGGAATAGIKLKATSDWNSDGNGTDDYGFAALPGGLYSAYGFYSEGDAGYWWSATIYTTAVSYMMDYLSSNVGKDASGDTVFFSIRCVKD